MDTNPYKHSEGVVEPQQRRRLGVLSRLGWFLAGFTVACVLCLSAGYVLSRPLDLTQPWPEGVRELVPELDWMAEAVAHRHGRIMVIVPIDAQNGSALISPVPPKPIPQVMFLDEDGNGEIDSISVFDARHRNFSIDVSDRRFTGYNYSPGVGDDHVTYRDGDMDGEFDYRHGPGWGHVIMVDGQWRRYEQEGDTRYVDLDGVRTPLNLKDGVWRIVEESSEDK